MPVDGIERRAAVVFQEPRLLGFLLIDSQNTGRTDILTLAIVLLALLGLAERRRLLRRWSWWLRSGRPVVGPTVAGDRPTGVPRFTWEWFRPLLDTLTFISARAPSR